ncbi:hypothetical protein [Streptomyces sp. NPDC005799]|uniref:hypothetical protein n=1 Tax=Streptomyces sp. NPDC005799 TaxID=3154678 RepID=UPI0033D86C66
MRRIESGREWQVSHETTFGSSNAYLPAEPEQVPRRGGIDSPPYLSRLLDRVVGCLVDTACGRRYALATGPWLWARCDAEQLAADGDTHPEEAVGIGPDDVRTLVAPTTATLLW